MLSQDSWYAPFRETIRDGSLLEVGELFHLRNDTFNDDTSREVLAFLHIRLGQRASLRKCNVCPKVFVDDDYILLHHRNAEEAGVHVRGKDDQVFYGLLEEEDWPHKEYIKHLIRKRV